MSDISTDEQSSSFGGHRHFELLPLSEERTNIQSVNGRAAWSSNYFLVDANQMLKKRSFDPQGIQ